MITLLGLAFLGLGGVVIAGGVTGSMAAIMAAVFDPSILTAAKDSSLTSAVASEIIGGPLGASEVATGGPLGQTVSDAKSILPSWLDWLTRPI